MSARGGAARRLVATVNHPSWQDSQFSPTWSPDSKRLIFSMTASDANPELYRVNTNGRGLKRLTFTRGSSHEYGADKMPDWSGTGRAVVFVSNREQRSSDLWVTDANGAGQRPIVRLRTSDNWHLHLSPDGRRVAFTKMPIGPGGPSTWVNGVDGSAARRLTNGTEPSWRPATGPRP